MQTPWYPGLGFSAELKARDGLGFISTGRAYLPGLLLYLHLIVRKINVDVPTSNVSVMREFGNNDSIQDNMKTQYEIIMCCYFYLFISLYFSCSHKMHFTI